MYYRYLLVLIFLIKYETKPFYFYGFSTKVLVKCPWVGIKLLQILSCYLGEHLSCWLLTFTHVPFLVLGWHWQFDFAVCVATLCIFLTGGKVDDTPLTQAETTGADGVDKLGRIYTGTLSLVENVSVVTDICSGQLDSNTSLWPFFLRSVRVTVWSSPQLDVKGDTGCFLFNTDKCSLACSDCRHAFSIWYLQRSQTARGRASFSLTFSLNTAWKILANLPVIFLFLFLSKNSQPHVWQKFPEVFIMS